ncbi:hypothetical protein SAMN06295912_12037 [Sphingomonas laterariae]|uniref:Uncharacterized protein n=1 Tax=Edaphosphingomonas laterariae TaxID=861865 RepID=A0A239I0B0_9SPHN|nr:hypothetical protein SAMN06295912_12037 [Sphingomonas laterariae]
MSELGRTPIIGGNARCNRGCLAYVAEQMELR